MDKQEDYVHKLNWMLFIMILVLVIFIFFSSIFHYLFVRAAITPRLDVEIVSNTIENTYNALRPIVSIRATSNVASIMTFDLGSDKYNTTFVTPGYTLHFEKTFFIPPEAHSTLFNLTVTAKDRDGHQLENVQSFETKKVFAPKITVK